MCMMNLRGKQRVTTTTVHRDVQLFKKKTEYQQAGALEEEARSPGKGLKKKITREIKEALELGPLSLQEDTAALDMENVEQLRVELDLI